MKIAERGSEPQLLMGWARLLTPQEQALVRSLSAREAVGRWGTRVCGSEPPFGFTGTMWRMR
eukprot:6742960-Prymnesium_polylepis.1